MGARTRPGGGGAVAPRAGRLSPLLTLNLLTRSVPGLTGEPAAGLPDRFME
ncbi:hypothetical protein [Nonomuraea sp. NPDC050643]|uniref:hypothetical protein n=1 Tax=Nonomuraea sp. NPDC050643 TaxID=3155660 RepID=UPI0033D3580E